MGTMTLEQARTRLRVLLADTSTDYTFSTNELNSTINEAYRDLQHATGLLEERTDINARLNEATYELPGVVGRIFRVTYDEYVLEEISRTELERLDLDYLSRFGDPWYFYRDMYDHDGGIQRIGLYPIPQVSGDEWVFDSEYGVVIGLDSEIFDGDLGTVVAMTADDGTRTMFDSEKGIILDISSRNELIEVWSKKEPLALTREDQAFELPDYVAQGVVFAAAAYILDSEREESNRELASTYHELANEAARFGRWVIGNRQPSGTMVVGKSVQKLRSRLNYDTRINVPAW